MTYNHDNTKVPCPICQQATYHSHIVERATGIMRNGEQIDIRFDDYTERALPKDQWFTDNGSKTIASGWMGQPVYWNHKGQYLDGSESPHKYDLIKVEGYCAYEYLYSR